MIGMETVKEFIREIRNKIKYVENGGSKRFLDINMNFILTGNPGTGKTTTARMLHKFLIAYGVLRKDTFVEVNALELKGQYCGSTAPKVMAVVDSAMGGTLFLDEAYALAEGDSFSKEAIATLLTSVENNRTGFLCIMAGYEDKMKELMSADPGLQRRFPKTLHLPNYSAIQLSQIAEQYAQQAFDLSFEEGLTKTLSVSIRSKYLAKMESHNGGLAIELVEKAVSRFASRMAALIDEGIDVKSEGNKLTAEDFGLYDDVICDDEDDLY